MLLLACLFVGIGLVTAQTQKVTGVVISEEDHEDNGWQSRRYMPCTPYKFPHSIEKKRDWRCRHPAIGTSAGQCALHARRHSADAPR